MPAQRLLRRRSQRTVDNAQSIAHGLQLSAISYQLSAISYQLSAISYQLQPLKRARRHKKTRRSGFFHQ
ncbi:hypothetical protein CUC76_06405 [Enterobacteriaceae bacterium S05]|nr:hypothetical protein CUC76_06405 [Enterobacteriaceae bacterium S05]